MQRMKSFFAGASVTATSVATFISTILKIEKFKLILSPAVFIQLIVASIALVISTNLTDEASDAAQEFEDDFKCAIFTANTPQQAKTNVLAVVSQIRQSYGVLTASLFYALAMITDWRKVTIENDGLILPEYIGQGDCSDCGVIGVDPIEFAGGWWIVPASEGEEFVNNDATFEVTNRIWSFIGTGANQHAQSYPAFSEFLATGRTWLEAGGTPVAGTPEHAGYVMLRLGGGDTNAQTFDVTGSGIIGVDGTNFPLHDVWTEWHVDSDLPKSEFQALLENVFDGLDIVHEVDQDFTNLAFHRMTMRGLDSDPRTVQFQVFAVIAETALNL
jgi:hypothetical protein